MGELFELDNPCAYMYHRAMFVFVQSQVLGVSHSGFDNEGFLIPVYCSRCVFDSPPPPWGVKRILVPNPTKHQTCLC